MPSMPTKPDNLHPELYDPRSKRPFFERYLFLMLNATIERARDAQGIWKYPKQRVLSNDN